MKCASCGYYNLPAATACGRCRRTLTPSTAGVPVDFVEIYPPRARNRPRGWRIREWRDRVVRRIPKPSIERPSIPRVSLESIREEMLKGLISSIGMIPGLGALAVGKRRRAAIQGSIAVGLVALTALTVHYAISDVLLWALAALAVYCRFDTLQSVYPAPNDIDRQTLRAFRHAAASVFAVAISVIMLMRIGGSVYLVNNPGLGPVVKQGDTLLVRAQSPARITRGEVVAADISSAGVEYRVPIADVGVQFEGVAVERVLGTDGDTVDLTGGVLSVNGRRLPTKALPLGKLRDTNAEIVVPKGSVCLLQSAFSVSFDDGPMPPIATSPFLLLPRSAIVGRVIAVIGPARDRRWIR